MAHVKTALAAVLLVAALTARADEPAFDLDVPPQPVAQVLADLTRQAGLQPLAAAEVVAGVQSPGVKGRLTLREAVARSLAGTGLAFEFTGPATVAITKAPPPPLLPKATAAPAPQQAELEEVAVTGERERAYVTRSASTATKTDTPLLETPATVSVVPQQVLQDQAVTSLEKALQNVPGVVRFATNQGLSDGFLLRGFGGNTTYRDGFFRPDILGGGTSKGELANVERIEVLKGPGSILFGRTEPGGVINVVTKQPLAQRQTSIQQEAGSWNAFRTALDSTGPVTEGGSLLYRVNASFEQSDSFRDFVTDQGVFVAPSLRANLGPRTQVTLEYEYQHFDDTPDPGVIPLDGRPVDVPRSRVVFEPRSNVNRGHRQLAALAWSHAFSEAWTLRQRISFEQFDLRNLTLFTGELQPDGSLERFFNDGGTQRSRRIATTVDLVGKVQTGPARHTLVASADFFRVKDGLFGLNCCTAAPPFNVFTPTYDPSAQVFDPAADFDLDFLQRWYGLSAQDQVELPGGVHLLAGARYDDAEGRSAGVVTDKGHRLSPRAAVLWRATAHASLFAGYSENFGASNSLFNPPDRRLPSQSAYQWEGGVKTEWMEGLVTATATVYQLTKRGLPTADPVNPSVAVAIGEARTRGLEVDATGQLLPGWSVVAGYAYLPFAEVTKDSQQELDDLGNVIGVNAGRTGNRLFLAPKHQGSLWSVYEFQSGAARGLRLGAGVVGVTSSFGDPDLTYRLPGYLVANAMVAYAFRAGPVKATAQLNVDNLLDRTYFPGSNSGSFIAVGSPRSLRGSLRAEF